MQITPFVRDQFTWLAYLMLAYYAYLQASLGPLMPFLRAELDLSYTVGGLHFSAFALGMILAGLTGHLLSRRWGRRPVFWGGGAGMAAGALWLVLGTRPLMTISAALLMGSMGALLLVMIQAALSDRHGEQRTIALTESNLAASLSAGLVPVFIGGFQGLGLGWRVALLLGAAAFLLLAVSFRSITIPAAGRIQKSGAAGRGLSTAYWAYWAVVVATVAIEWSLVFWGADFLANVVGLDRAAAAATMSIFFLAAVLGRFTGSRLARILPGATLLLAALGIAAAGFLLFWLATSAPFSVAGLFVAGFGVSNLFPLGLSLATGVAAQQADLASARITLGSGAAILIAPLTLGWAADQVGIKSAFVIAAVLFGVAAAIALVANRLAMIEASPGEPTS